jgi:hypothetical protein
LTLVLAGRVLSQDTNWLKRVGVMDRLSHPAPEQMWWKVKGTHPPTRSALVTTAFNWASVHVLSIMSTAARLKGSSGGIDPAAGQPGQPWDDVTSPRVRALLYPQSLTACSTVALKAEYG